MPSPHTGVVHSGVHSMLPSGPWSQSSPTSCTLSPQLVSTQSSQPSSGLSLASSQGWLGEGSPSPHSFLVQSGWQWPSRALASPSSHFSVPSTMPLPHCIGSGPSLPSIGSIDVASSVDPWLLDMPDDDEPPSPRVLSPPSLPPPSSAAKLGFAREHADSDTRAT